MESRIFIEIVKHGGSIGGLACGPVSGSLNTAVKIKRAKTSKWLTLSEVDGIPVFTLTDDDIFDKLMEDDFATEFQTHYQESIINQFENVPLGDYEGLYTWIKEHESSPASALLEYIMAIQKCPDSDLEEYIKAGEGKYVEDIDERYLGGRPGAKIYA